MFDDLAVVIQSENVDAGPITVARPLLVAVEDNVVALGDHAFEVYALARVVLRHPSEVGNKRLLAVRCGGVVLNVNIANIPCNCLPGLSLVEHQVVKRHHVLLVLLLSISHECTSWELT